MTSSSSPSTSAWAMRLARSSVGLGPSRLPDAARVVEHLDHRAHRRRRPPTLGRGVDRLGERVERDAVLVRDAEHVGDHVRRHQPGDVGDEVALAALGDAVDDARASSSMRGRIACATFGMNSLRDDLAQRVCCGGSVISIIWWSPRSMPAVVGDHDRRPRRERRRVAADGPDVGVAGDRPEARAAVRLGVPVHRVVLAQPAELLVRLAVRERLHVRRSMLRQRLRPIARQYFFFSNSTAWRLRRELAGTRRRRATRRSPARTRRCSAPTTGARPHSWKSSNTPSLFTPCFSRARPPASRCAPRRRDCAARRSVE